jgi:hypothetical protein
MRRNLLKIPIGRLQGDSYPFGAFADFVPIISIHDLSPYMGAKINR